MMKEKKWNVYAICVAALMSISISLAFRFNLFASWSPETISDIVNPLFFGILCLMPTLAFLLWRGEIFISWLKHIAWWFLLGIGYFILFVSSENESFLSPGRVQIVMFFMAILFIITLIYALVMNRKLKKGDS